jgi:thioredoxin reductase
VAHLVAQRVAVIGAGPSGLATVKELLAEGHEPVCFERAASLGGVFRRAEDDGVCWDSCRLVSSGVLTAFSDFPVSPDRSGHMKAGEYLDYMSRYAQTFGVMGRIQFGTTVQQVTRQSGGGWQVRTSTKDGETLTGTFDAVAVCTGLVQIPNVPHFPGADTFTGQVLHSAQYRHPEQLHAKRVLVVGGGESGAEIAAEAAVHAAEVTLSLRRGIAVRPRKTSGLPHDHQITRLNHSPSPWIYQTRHPDDGWKRRIYRAMFFPLLVGERGLQTASRFFYEVLPLFHPRRLAGGRAALVEVRTALRVRRLTKALLKESGGRVLEQFGTKSDDFVRAMALGRCRRVGAIERFEGSRVHFSDRSSIEPDLVIYCTGFSQQASFLDETSSGLPRFLHTFNPGVGKSLAFIGQIRPAFGAIPPMGELQARWFAQLLSGAVALPPESEMRAATKRQTQHERRFFRALDGRLSSLVDFTTACDALASQIGCKPTEEAIGRESREFRRRFFAAPFVSAQYRLVGPHAAPEIARRVIESLPIAHPPPMLMAYHLHWRLSRLLHRLFGHEFAPKLDLKVR